MPIFISPHCVRLLLVCSLVLTICCQQQPTNPSTSVDSAAILAAVNQADTLPADQAYRLAQALPDGVAQDSFYAQLLQRVVDRVDMEALRQHLTFYQQLRGGQPGPDILLYYRSSDIDLLENNFSAGEEKVRNLLQRPELMRDTGFQLELINTLGHINRWQGRKEQAMQCFVQALNLAAAVGDSINLADGWQTLGEIHTEAHEPEQALPYIRRALGIYEKTGDLSWQATCYRMLADNFFQQKDTAAAIINIEKCIEIREKLQLPPFLVEAYLAYAKMLTAQAEYPKALAAAEKARYWHEQQPLPFWEAALQHGLGVGFLMVGETAKAKPYLFAALKMAQQEQDKNIERTAYLHLSRLFKKENQPAVALGYLEKSNALKDSLFTMEREKTVQELMVKYETAQKESRLTELEKQQKITRLQVLVGLLGFTLALGMMLFLFLRLRHRRARLEQENLLLEQEKHVLEQAGQLAEAQALLQHQALKRSVVALRDKDNELLQSTQLLTLKNQLIADLEMRIAEQTQAQEERPYAAQGSAERSTPLYRMKILTEADWQRFRESFEQGFPGFLQRLRAAFPQLTTAETRLFLLLKLGFDTKEIAGILGISVESVWKSRQRLRKKLSLAEEVNFDGFVREFP